MAIGTVQPTIQAAGPKPMVVPISLTSDWQDLCTDVATADNGGSVVTNPGGITRSAQNRLDMLEKGTMVEVCLQYPAGASITTSLTVQPFGIDTAGVTQRLLDDSDAHELTLAVSANDPTNGTVKWTQPVNVDASACRYVLAAVKTALAGTGISGAKLLGRVK